MVPLFKTVLTLWSWICFCSSSMVSPPWLWPSNSSSTWVSHHSNSARSSSHCRHSRSMSSSWFLRADTFAWASPQWVCTLSTVDTNGTWDSVRAGHFVMQGHQNPVRDMVVSSQVTIGFSSHRRSSLTSRDAIEISMSAGRKYFHGYRSQISKYFQRYRS